MLKEDDCFYLLLFVSQYVCLLDYLKSYEWILSLGVNGKPFMLIYLIFRPGLANPV